MDADKTCTATFSAIRLTVIKTGTGAGTVTSTPGGISCGSDCTQDYALNTQVTLTAAPNASSVFTGWSGDQDCSDGIVSMDSAKSCSAAFEQSSGQFTLNGDKNRDRYGNGNDRPRRNKLWQRLCGKL